MVSDPIIIRKIKFTCKKIKRVEKKQSKCTISGWKIRGSILYGVRALDTIITERT